MKKKLISAVFGFVCCTHVALSQGWRIAPAIGVNVAAISYSSAFRNAVNAGINTSTTSISYGPIVRFQAGALLDYAFSDRFSIRSGLLYTGKGGSARITVSVSGTTQSVQTTFELNYLEIPLLFNIAMGSGSYRLVGGPVLGVALNGKYVVPAGMYTGAGYTTNYKIGSDVNSSLMPTDLSVSLGLVKELQLGDRPLEIGLYAQPSISSWTTISKTIPDRYARNFLAGLRIAYLFELRR